VNLGPRLARLERGGSRTGWRAYVGLPNSEWPDSALMALLAESEGWPLGYVPTDDDLRAIIERSGGEGGEA
jgi:hypothetical protein